MLEVVCVSFALVFGLASRQIGLPPLVGFLAAGFSLNILADKIGLPPSISITMQHLAHLGVLMLLFSVGLKLKFKQMVKSEVVGGALLHFLPIFIILTAIVYFVFEQSLQVSLLLGVSLSFSSTVLAAKTLETKKELSLFHGRTVIGILIIQDLVALIVLAIASGKTPNMFALLLLGLPFYRLLLHRLVSLAGHGELMVLAAVLLSVVIGGASFTAMGLSSELGALVVGALLANHPHVGEVSDSLASLKDLFLVCFFLSAGMMGLPTIEGLVFASIFALLLPLKAFLFFWILVVFKLRARTAFLSSLALMSYSEFGLIVIAATSPEFIVEIALAMAFSFVIAAPVNRYAHNLFERFEGKLSKLQLDSIHPDEQPTKLGDANILILGMGRTGFAAYQFFENTGYRPIGLDADTYVIQRHQEQGRNAAFADAEDVQFWSSINLTGVKAVIFAMDDIESKLISARMLKKYNFTGPVISHALHEDHQERIKEAGATHTYLTMSQAGVGLAESTILALEKKSANEKL